MDKLEMARQTRAALLAFTSGATTLTDEQAMNMASTFPVWPEGVNSDGQYVEGQIVQDEGQIYRVMQPTVTPLENQPPHAEGMLAVYRPIEVEHTGTIEDPIPWVYGMDCYTGKYYSYEGKVYLCKGDMIPCVWTPGSAGLWQWEEVTAEEPEPEPTEPTGTIDDPIPFVMSMNTEQGKYYSYEGETYLCTLTMTPCVWAPGSEGVYQWEKVTADDSSPEETV